VSKFNWKLYKKTISKLNNHGEAFRTFGDFMATYKLPECQNWIEIEKTSSYSLNNDAWVVGLMTKMPRIFPVDPDSS